MQERWGDAFESWAAEHRRLATVAGVGLLGGTVVAGLLVAGEPTGLSLVTGAAVVTLALFAVVSKLTGRPVMFGLFGAGAAEPRDPGLSIYEPPDSGWFGDGGGGGGDGGGGS